MTHPDAFRMACCVFRLCGYAIEQCGEDGELARVIDVASATPLGWICTNGLYQPERIPTRKPALIGRFVACVLDFCAVALDARVPLPEFPPAKTGGDS